MALFVFFIALCFLPFVSAYNIKNKAMSLSFKFVISKSHISAKTTYSCALSLAETSEIATVFVCVCVRKRPDMFQNASISTF